MNILLTFLYIELRFLECSFYFSMLKCNFSSHSVYMYTEGIDIKYQILQQFSCRETVLLATGLQMPAHFLAVIKLNRYLVVG